MFEGPSVDVAKFGRKAKSISRLLVPWGMVQIFWHCKISVVEICKQALQVIPLVNTFVEHISTIKGIW